jgi:hypothetical protein
LLRRAEFFPFRLPGSKQHLSFHVNLRDGGGWFKKFYFAARAVKTLRKMGHDSCLQNALLAVL